MIIKLKNSNLVLDFKNTIDFNKHFEFIFFLRILLLFDGNKRKSTQLSLYFFYNLKIIYYY